MAQILDCSGAHLNGEAVKNAGYHGAIRYLKKEDPSSVVPINDTEYNSLVNAGRSVAYIYQHVSKGRVTQGRDAGKHDAQWALSQLPKGAHPRAIYGVVVDYDAPASDFPKIIEYARGWCDVLGVQWVGAYGKDIVLQALKTAGVASWFWQTAAWSGGRKFAPRHLYQKVGYVNVGGVQCDVNDCTQEDWGQEGVDMAITDDDAAKIARFVNNDWKDNVLNTKDDPRVLFKGPDKNPDGTLVERTYRQFMEQNTLWVVEGVHATTDLGKSLMVAIADNGKTVDLTPEDIQTLLAGFGPATKQALKDALREGTG